MLTTLEHSSYLSNEQRQHVLALLCALPVGCTCTSEQLLPCGHFAFTINGPSPILAELRKQLIEIVGFDTPGLRSYTLQEAYNTFGWRSYTNVHRKQDTGSLVVFCDRNGYKTREIGREMIIDGMVISSGQIQVRIRQDMDASGCAYFTLDELARDFEWPDGEPCGIVMPSKSIQKRLAVQRGEDMLL